MNNYPRSIFFKNGKAIKTNEFCDYDSIIVMNLPSDHYDFIGPINVIGKSKSEIEEEIKNLCP